MTWKKPFPEAAKEYIRQNINEWPSVLAYNIGKLFDYPCTDRGVREQIKKIRADSPHVNILYNAL
jgi:hypothetical protein